MLAAVNKAVLIEDKTMSQFTCMRNVYFTYTHAQLKVSRATPRSRVLVSPSLELYVSTPLADAGGFHGFHGNPLLRESLPARTEIIVRMRASYSHAHSRVCVLHATNRDVQTTAPLTVCS